MNSCQTPIAARRRSISHVAPYKLLIPAFLICTAVIASSQSALAQFVLQAPMPVSDENGPAVNLGTSVALSSDGNTAIVGGPNDNSATGAGAVWIFTRGGNSWTQQAKLIGSGLIGAAMQGISVALSSQG